MGRNLLKHFINYLCFILNAPENDTLTTPIMVFFIVFITSIIKIFASWNGQCVGNYYHCNGHSDCSDGEDERDCYHPLPPLPDYDGDYTG